MVDFEGILHEAVRKQRRNGILLAILGAVCALAGVFLGVIGSWWLGAAAIAFGVMCIATGTSMMRPEGSPAARLCGIVGCIAFAVAGALMIITTFVDPTAFGWRGAWTGVIAGAPCLVFFGAGAIILIHREVKRRKRNS